MYRDPLVRGSSGDRNMAKKCILATNWIHKEPWFNKVSQIDPSSNCLFSPKNVAHESYSTERKKFQ